MGGGFSSSAIPPGTDDAIVRQAKRLYVGGIPPFTPKEYLVEFLNAEMLKRGFCKNPSRPPVLDAQIVPEKAFAFVEFADPVEANNGMLLDGTVFEVHFSLSHSLPLHQPIFPFSCC